LPKDPGIYLFLDKKGNVLYVGKAKNLKNRVASYFRNTVDLGPKTRILLSKTEKIKTVIVRSEIEALLLEANFIKKLQPLYNIRLTDGKSYPLIRITVKDKYPAVLIARRMEEKNSLYFGPYPNVSQMKLVLRTIRKIFPYKSVARHPKKPCLFNHLGLCPCPEFFNDKNYKKSIRRIAKLLNGKIEAVIKSLEKERNLKSKEEKFEAALTLQKQIEAIKHITTPNKHPFEYEINPNLKEDLKKSELDSLIIELKKHDIELKSLRRIECYDISNILGTNPTGSMVVFINGEKDTSQYRKFKIDPKKYRLKANDPMMIKEIIQRRLNHKEWEMPDLIIVDGGKAQVSAAKDAISDKNYNTAVIGLAKREETIITENLKEIKLGRNSPGLHLIQRIRDEAHRFAISYHRLLRLKLISG